MIYQFSPLLAVLFPAGSGNICFVVVRLVVVLLVVVRLAAGRLVEGGLLVVVLRFAGLEAL